MKYRVKFRLDGGTYYTAWFDTFMQAEYFVRAANAAGNDVFPLAIENSEYETV